MVPNGARLHSKICHCITARIKFFRNNFNTEKIKIVFEETIQNFTFFEKKGDFCDKKTWIFLD